MRRRRRRHPPAERRGGGGAIATISCFFWLLLLRLLLELWCAELFGVAVFFYPCCLSSSAPACVACSSYSADV